jgi:pimeloyl-ACP methyl ester carboxylesterase
MPRNMPVRSGPIFVWCTVLVVVLAGCRTGPSHPNTAATVGTASVQATTGRIATRVDIGGHNLNLNCKGAGSPTIVFENGLGSNLAAWFQTGIADAFPSVRTCAYDRVNAGTSDRVLMRHTGQDSVRDLHTLLGVAAVPGPYLLVGHSFGGLLVAMYAGTYPTEVQGLVMIDPSLPTLAEYEPIPEPERSAGMAAQEQNPENLDYWDTLPQADALVPKIPDIPVLVLAATSLGYPPAELGARKKALQDFIARLPRGELRYVDSGHFIHSEQPKLVISEIQEMLDNVR